jgi:hypothetical protein
MSEPAKPRATHAPHLFARNRNENPCGPPQFRPGNSQADVPKYLTDQLLLWRFPHGNLDSITKHD